MLTIGGEHWPFHERAYVMLQKPVGYECSYEPKHWPSVYELLPLPLRQRPTKSAVNGVQAVGRLDQDTTGLLILRRRASSFIAWRRRSIMCAQGVRGHHRSMVSDADVDALLHGVVLHDDPVPTPVAAAACERNAHAFAADTHRKSPGEAHDAAVGNRGSKRCIGRTDGRASCSIRCSCPASGVGHPAGTTWRR